MLEMASRSDRVLMVFVRHALGAHSQLTDLSARERSAVAVDDLELDPWHRRADRFDGVRIAAGVRRRDASELARAIVNVEQRVEACPETLPQAQWHARAARIDGRAAGERIVMRTIVDEIFDSPVVPELAK